MNGIGTADGGDDENNGCDSDAEMGRRQGTRIRDRRSWTVDG